MNSVSHLQILKFYIIFIAVRNTTVGLERVETPVDMKMWPQFHNGVAAGLRIAQGISQVNTSRAFRGLSRHFGGGGGAIMARRTMHVGKKKRIFWQIILVEFQ